MAAEITHFLSFRGITKRFPGVLALDDVSFGIERGTCHALMGENGAGKSTLGKILAGIYQPDAGVIQLEGNPVAPANPLAARQLGIAMVHQELAFCPNLTVAENLCLGDLPRTAGFVSRRALRQRARAMLDQIETDLDVDLPLDLLSPGQEQLVQIAAAVGTGARVIVMDEPTSSLSAGESEHLFHLLNRLKENGMTVIYVSHRLEEIFRLCDTITVLRDGKHVSTTPQAATSPDRVIQQMIGRELVTQPVAHLQKAPGRELLRVENLSSPGKFENVSFRLHAGEILGLAGLVGAGRSEIAQAVFGLDKTSIGTVSVGGRQLASHSVTAAMKNGIGFLPEDRKKLGLVLGLSCLENTSLAMLERLSSFGFIQRKKEETLTTEYVSRLQVKTPSLHSPVAGLSGGNQQKIALAKWLARHGEILIVDEPTRGVDVGAKAEIHRLIDDLAFQGLGVILISSELPEIIHLCGRAIILREGKVQGELVRAEFSQAKFMRLMAGLQTAA